jgi:hypothetical protein
MKNHLMRTLPPVLLLLTAGMQPGLADTVQLYLQPDIHASNIASVALDDPRLGQPAPVMEEARAALGWHYADYTDLVTAYVPDSRIGKDLLPVDDAVLHAAPDSDSPVLGLFSSADQPEIVDSGEWWTLRLRKTFPVYFLLDEPPPLPPVTAAAPGSLIEITPAAPAAEAPAGQLIDAQPAFDPSSAQSSGTAAAVPVREPALRTSIPGLTSKSYEGIFKRSRRTLGLFTPAEPFYLEGTNGKRIAWVDTSEIVVPGSLKSFLDQRVIVHGEREYKASSKDWIIRARNMRVK